MPSPIEEPGFKSQGTDLPKGSAQELEAGLDLAAAGGAATIGDFTDQPDEFDDFAFEPTWFPQRPLTHGASFGPGANTVATPPRNEDDMLDDIAAEMIRTGGPESNQIWAARRLAGE
jgi:hypothetical protein